MGSVSILSSSLGCTSAAVGSLESCDPERWCFVVVVWFCVCFHHSLCDTESIHQGDQELEQLGEGERETWDQGTKC